VALLNADTGRAESMLPDPIMRPEFHWERNGDVDNVVFVQDAVPRPDGTISSPTEQPTVALARRSSRPPNSSHPSARPPEARELLERADNSTQTEHPRPVDPGTAAP
jgi:hypothetical protein